MSSVREVLLSFRTRFLENLFGSFLKWPEHLALFETLNRATSVNKENKASTLEQTLSLLTTLLDEAKAGKLIGRDIYSDSVPLQAEHISPLVLTLVQRLEPS